MLKFDPRREWRFVRYASGNFGKHLVSSTADLTLASQILTAITIGQFGGVVVWTSLVRYFDKTQLLIASLAATVVTLCLFAAAAPNQWAMLGAASLMGVALLGVYMLPWGILPDVVDFCELRQGYRQETTFFAVFLVAHKASGAAASGSIGWVLAITGYARGAQQSPLVVGAIAFLAFGVPVIGALAAIATLLPLRIGHRRHAAALRKPALRAANSYKNTNPEKAFVWL
jgi:glycoside/pentoside/hexuronide:cation symporter, GPH family